MKINKMKSLLIRIILSILLVLINISKCKSQQQQQQQPQSFSSVCQSGIREDNTNYIYCARRSLTEVPLFSKNNVVYDELVLSDNRILQLSLNSFSRIKVKKVYLNGNPIRSIDAQSFSKLENYLEELWLDSEMEENNENSLDQQHQSTRMIGLPKAIVNLRNLNTLRLKGFLVKQLDNSVLKRLNRIEILSLQFCSIESIDKFAFEGLKNSLKELYLDGNQLQSIPTESLTTPGFKNLKVLGLSQNNIKIINSDSFGYSSQFVNSFYDLNSNSQNWLSLIKLDLSYNGLKQIDSQAFNSFNTSLEILLLQNNEINSYNLKFIRQLQQLKELNLDFNLISKLSPNLFSNSAKLQFLSLQGNSIQFDDLIQNEFSLSSLENQIENSKSIFDGLIGLQRLNLARNGIKHLPNGLFKPIKNLKSLILDKNLIDNLNEFTFDGLFLTLMNISLQNTKLKSSNLISLKNFEKLERIKLGFNELDEIEWSLFTNMHSTLTNLDLQNNKINQIIYDLTNSSSLQMENLLELDLSNNKLCEFNSNNILEKMPKLKNLGLSQNPLYCDCNMLSLYEWTKRKFDKDILNYIQWQCEMPAESNMQNSEFYFKPKQIQNTRKFTTLSSSDFICKNTTKSKCQIARQEIKQIQTTTTFIPTTLSTSTTNQAAHFLVAESNAQVSRIASIQLKSELNSVYVNWELDTNDENQLKNENIRGFKLTYTKSDNNSDLSTFLVDKSQRTFKIENLAYESRYTICVSIVRSQGYDKFCRDIETQNELNHKSAKKQVKSTNQSALLISSSSTSSFSQSSDYLSSNSNIISGLMISILVILLIFIFCLIVFIFFYIKKCRLNQKNLKKSLYASSSTGNTLGSTTRRAVYQGAILSSGADHKPIETSTINDPNKCCCLLGQNAIGNQRFINCVGLVHANGHTYATTCNSLGRALTVGDTSTVSSTLSSVNNNNSNSNNSNNSNNQVGDILTISPTNNLTDWRFKASNQKGGYEQSAVAVMTTNHQVDLASSTPTSFTHFIVQPNSQQINEQAYMPYEVYNCFQNPNTGALIVPTNQQQIQFLSNTISNNSKKGKLIQNQFGFNVLSPHKTLTTNLNDHVYCEIPSTIGRTYRGTPCLLNTNLNDTQMLIKNSHNCNNTSSCGGATSTSTTSNRQNSSASLLLSSSSTSSSSTSSNSSSPQSNFTNNTKYTNASII